MREVWSEAVRMTGLVGAFLALTAVDIGLLALVVYAFSWVV